MKKLFLLICVFFIVFQTVAFSKSSEKNQVSRTSKKLESEQKGSLSNKEKSKSQKAKTNCHLSARSQKAIKSYTVSNVDSFLNKEDIEDLLDMHLDDIKKGWPNKCPKPCKAVNDYSIFAKTYPLSVSPNSCDKTEAKEVYPLNKKFVIGGQSKADKQKAYKKTRDWVFSVFVNPFYPFAKNPPKEFTDNNLGKACPSCSFYLDYTYKYTADNQLDLNVTARCGDRRTFFSKYKSEFFLVNHWKCAKKKP
ncbi:MAG: hypothetical protein OXJ52_06525 [Oligoflexia bacterium]|nr:hypothetical protein [Oligoflexia bacterium]